MDEKIILREETSRFSHSFCATTNNPQSVDFLIKFCRKIIHDDMEATLSNNSTLNMHTCIEKEAKTHRESMNRFDFSISFLLFPEQYRNMIGMLK